MSELSPHCENCQKIENEKCSVYSNPIILMRWVDNPKIKIGCSFNRENIINDGVENKRVRVGQQKQKKRK